MGELDANLKRLIAETQREEAGKLREEFEQRLRAIPAGDGKLYKEFESQKRDIEEISKAVSSALSEIGKIRAELKEKQAPKREIDDIRHEVAKAVDLSRKAYDRIDAEVELVEQRLKGEKQVPVPDFARQLEGLRAKLEWLEDTVESLGLEKIYDKIEEIESKLKSMRVSAPVVLE